MSEIASISGAWSYRTGDWFAVFGSKVTILLPESQKDRVVDLWALVDGGQGFDEVLDGLLASGLSKIPGFVLLSTDGGPTRVLLRGEGVVATLTAGDEEVVLDGAASHTWVERSLDGVTRFSITLPSAEVSDADYPVQTGLVRVGRIDRPAYDGSGSVDSAGSSGAASGEAPGVPVVAPVGVPGGSIGEAAGVAPAVDSDEVRHDSSEATGQVDEADEIDEAASVVSAVDSDEVVGAADEPVAEDAAAEEDMAGASAMSEPSPLDEGPATELMPTIDDSMTAGMADPLTDPLPAASPEAADAPAQPAPDDWVTPWDAPAAPAAADAPATRTDAPDPDADTMAPGSAGDVAGVVPSDLPQAPSFPPPNETEVVPTGWAPPPPPPGVAVPAAPPLPVGSWEPLGGGSYPPPPPVPSAAEAPSAPAPVPPDAPMAPPAPAAPLVPDAPMADDDHDGHTRFGAAPPEPAAAAEPDAADVPAVDERPAAGPVVAQLVISDGQHVSVDKPILIGRAPEARRFAATEQPVLVTVPSRLHEISSTHVEVRPGTGADHGTAVVTDMGSTNGTVLVQPGLGPEDLKPGIAVQLIPGAVINLGDGITIQVTRP